MSHVSCTAVSFPSQNVILAAFASTVRLFTLGTVWTQSDAAVSGHVKTLHGFSNVCPDCGTVFCFGGHVVHELRVSEDATRLKFGSAVRLSDWVLDVALVGECGDDGEGHEAIVALAHNAAVRLREGLKRVVSKAVCRPTSVLAHARVYPKKATGDPGSGNAPAEDSGDTFRIFAGTMSGSVLSWSASLPSPPSGDQTEEAPPVCSEGVVEGTCDGFTGVAFGVDSVRLGAEPRHNERQELARSRRRAARAAAEAGVDPDAYVEISIPRAADVFVPLEPVEDPAAPGSVAPVLDVDAHSSDDETTEWTEAEIANWVACAADDRSVRIWRDDVPRYVLWGSQARPWSVQWMTDDASPVGPIGIAVGGEDGALRLFNQVDNRSETVGDAQLARVEWTAVRHASHGGVRCIAVRDGWVCAGGDNGSLTVWDSRRVMRGETSFVYGVPVRDDAAKVRSIASHQETVAVVADNSLWLRDPMGRWSEDPCTDSKSPVMFVVPTIGGSWFALHKDGTVRLRAGVSLRPLTSLVSCAIDARARFLLVVSWNGAFAVVDSLNGVVVARNKFDLRSRESVTSCAVRSDMCLAIGTSDGSVCVGWITDVGVRHEEDAPGTPGGANAVLRRFSRLHSSAVTDLMFAEPFPAAPVVETETVVVVEKAPVSADEFILSPTSAFSAVVVDGSAAASTVVEPLSAGFSPPLMDGGESLLYASCKDGRIGRFALPSVGVLHVQQIGRPQCVRDAESVEAFVRCGSAIVVRVHVAQGAVFCQLPADSPDCVVGRISKLGPRACVACSSDSHGAFVASVVSGDASVTEYQWPLNNRECVTLQSGGHSAIVNIVRATPRGSALFATAADDGRWALWDGEMSGEALLWRKSGNAIRALAWADDSVVFLATATDVYKWQHGRLLSSVALPTPVEGLVCRSMWCTVSGGDESSEATRIWVGDSAGTVFELRSQGDSTNVTRSVRVASYCLSDGCLAPDGASLWVVTTNGSLMQLSALSLEQLGEWRLTKCALLTVSCADALLATAGDDGSVVFLRSTTGSGDTAHFEVNVGHFATIVSVLLLPGSIGSGLLRLLVLSKDECVSLWNVNQRVRSAVCVRRWEVEVQNPTSMDALYHEETDIWTACIAGGNGTCTIQFRDEEK